MMPPEILKAKGIKNSGAATARIAKNLESPTGSDANMLLKIIPIKYPL
jgi:hypothetical protein